MIEQVHATRVALDAPDRAGAVREIGVNGKHTGIAARVRFSARSKCDDDSDQQQQRDFFHVRLATRCHARRLR
jgi:hypothetical protein